jgi:hypothetical protein
MTRPLLGVVYDALAKASLNKRIIDILLRFRMYPIAIVGDIEKAFLMVRITESDQNILRFLWYKDVNVENPEIMEYKFTRVVFALGPSPYLLNATIAQHLEQFKDLFENNVNRIRESLYVDNVVMGADSVSEAFELHKESKEIFLKGGFNLRKFITNCEQVQSRINILENCSNSILDLSESYAQFTLGGVAESRSDQQKVLGVSWEVGSDELIFNLEHILIEAEGIEPTKRRVIGLVSKIYDPLGMVSPVIIELKIFFQELCLSKLDWDEPLIESLRDKWNILMKGLKSEPLKIPRWCLDTPHDHELKFIGFCDASMQ